MWTLERGSDRRRERHLRNEELYDLCFVPNIILVIKAGRMRWAGHVACMGVKGNACRVLGGGVEPEG